MILEELSIYLLALRDDLKYHEILPYNDVLMYGEHEVGNNKKYTHLWFESKFKSEYIELIKYKIKKDFPKYYDLVMKYENDVLNKVLEYDYR